MDLIVNKYVFHVQFLGRSEKEEINRRGQKINNERNTKWKKREKENGKKKNFFLT